MGHIGPMEMLTKGNHVSKLSSTRCRAPSGLGPFGLFTQGCARSSLCLGLAYYGPLAPGTPQAFPYEHGRFMWFRITDDLQLGGDGMMLDAFGI